MTQLYVEGALRFSSLVAGLCTARGVGLAVLWRVNPSWKQNLFNHRPDLGLRRAVGVGIQIVVPSSPEYLQNTCTFSSEKRAGAFYFGDKASIL